MLIKMYTGDKFMICMRDEVFNFKYVLENGLKVSFEVTPLVSMHGLVSFHYCSISYL